MDDALEQRVERSVRRLLQYCNIVILQYCNIEEAIVRDDEAAARAVSCEGEKGKNLPSVDWIKCQLVARDRKHN